MAAGVHGLAMNDRWSLSLGQSRHRHVTQETHEELLRTIHKLRDGKVLDHPLSDGRGPIGWIRQQLRHGPV